MSSQNCSSLDVIISSAVADGKTLVLFDVDHLHPAINSLLMLTHITPNPDMTLDIRIGTKIITWDSKFKLILISSQNDVSQIDPLLESRVTVIDGKVFKGLEGGFRPLEGPTLTNFSSIGKKSE